MRSGANPFGVGDPGRQDAGVGAHATERVQAIGSDDEPRLLGELTQRALRGCLAGATGASG